MWRENVDALFAGVEECPICYVVVHAVTRALPALACRTCNNKFHSACLYKWFSSSQKSTCPLCQSPF
jgi:E3 ubiquitin-protein ligase DOA10